MPEKTVIENDIFQEDIVDNLPSMTFDNRSDYDFMENYIKALSYDNRM